VRIISVTKGVEKLLLVEVSSFTFLERLKNHVLDRSGSMTLLDQACERKQGKMTEQDVSLIKQSTKMKGGDMLRSKAMTIGQLSRRTGVPIKVLRTYEDLGFLYTPGRSESNYRLFGEEAVWCVQVIQGLRSLGLTLKEIQSLVTSYLERPDELSDALLEAQLAQALARVEARITVLQALRQRILEFQAACAGAPAPPEASALAQLLASDPRR
jgi:DNA-binding transcriptional MerR regulator